MTMTATEPPGVLTDTREGWYLLAQNSVVECGPFPDEASAVAAAVWMDENGQGVNPAPWRPKYSAAGLRIGSRWRAARRPSRQLPG